MIACSQPLELKREDVTLLFGKYHYVVLKFAAPFMKVSSFCPTNHLRPANDGH